MFSVEELIDPLEVEAINLLLSPDKMRMRSLTTTFFSFRVPLTPTSSSSTYKAIQVDSRLCRSAESILVGLIWEACYGKKFKVIHWYILFRVLERTSKDRESSRGLYFILGIISANAGKSWNTNMDSVLKILRRQVSVEKADKIIKEALSKLPLRFPKSRPKTFDLLKITTVVVDMKKPKEPKRIGVGYRDKGSLSGSSKVEPLPPDRFVETVDVFERLLRQFNEDLNKYNIKL